MHILHSLQDKMMQGKQRNKKHNFLYNLDHMLINDNVLNKRILNLNGNYLEK